nr:MAG TPA: hypothetical protein [Caudoviricetes sp.]
MPSSRPGTARPFPSAMPQACCGAVPRWATCPWTWRPARATSRRAPPWRAAASPV